MDRISILITGGEGYIARSLYTGLKESFDITCISRRDFDLTRYDQAAHWFKDKYFDVVIHTAISGGARLSVDDDSVVSKNLQMYYILVSLEEHFGKFITFGSGAEVTMPWEPYGFSKRVIAESLEKRDEYYNLRIRAVFDENELDRRFIKSNIIRYIKKEPMIIHQDKFMDFFYMKDLCRLVRFYINSVNAPKVSECSYSKKYLLSEIADIINSMSTYKVPVIVERDGMAEDYIGSSSPNMDFIGLSQGIKEVYNKLV